MTAITIVTPSTAYCLADLSHVEVFSSLDLDLAVKDARRRSGPGYLVSARSLLREERASYLSVDGAEFQKQDRGDPFKLATAMPEFRPNLLSVIDVSTRSAHFLPTGRNAVAASLCYRDPIVAHEVCLHCERGNRPVQRTYVLGVSLGAGVLMRHSFARASAASHYIEPGVGQFVSLRWSREVRERPMPTPFTYINKLDLNNDGLSFDEVEPSEERLAQLLYEIHDSYAFSLPSLVPSRTEAAA
jgi:hypothetical protein